MKLSKNQFELLVVIEREKNKLNQRELARLTNLSLGTINKIIIELKNANFIDENNCITELGLNTLEPYRVKRAIFLAAGFGSRLVPITLNTPKPLIRVNGKRIIETLLDAVVAAEIPEIIIVTGYLHEQFEELKHKYPNIKLIVNEKYNVANNILSANLIKDQLANAYVLESDFYLYNNLIVRKYEYSSNYLGKYMDVTDDWCLETKNDIVTKEKIGGYNCYQMLGMAYFNEEDAKKLEVDIDKVCNMPGGKERYWDQVFFEVFKNNYKITIRKCNPEDIIEIDTFEELKMIDKTYDV